MGYGDGSIYYVEKRGLWFAAIEDGWTPQGKRRRRVVSSKTKAGVRRKLEQAKRERDAGITGANPTVKTYGNQWLERQAARVRPGTLRGFKTAIGVLTKALGRKQVKDVRGTDLEALGVSETGRGLSPATVIGEQTIWGMMFKDAARDGLNVHVSVPGFKKVKKGEGKRAAIPAVEVARLVKAARSIPGGVRFTLSLILGLRPAEVAGLRWQDIDFETGTLRVEFQLVRLRTPPPPGMVAHHVRGLYYLTLPKTASGARTIPLPGDLLNQLREWREKTPGNEWGLVFQAVRGGGPLCSDSNRRVWEKLQKDAGVAKTDGKPYLLYEARHTAATLMLEAGVAPMTIAAIMGHSGTRMQSVYQHPGRELELEGLRKVEGLIS